MKQNQFFVIFSTNVVNWNYFPESIKIKDLELTDMEGIKWKINELIENFNRVEIQRYGPDVFKRTLRDVIWYIPAKENETHPKMIWKYNGHSEVPDSVKEYTTWPTLSLYKCKSFDWNKDIYITL